MTAATAETLHHVAAAALLRRTQMVLLLGCLVFLLCFLGLLGCAEGLLAMYDGHATPQLPAVHMPTQQILVSSSFTTLGALAGACLFWLYGLMDRNNRLAAIAIFVMLLAQDLAFHHNELQRPLQVWPSYFDTLLHEGRLHEAADVVYSQYRYEQTLSSISYEYVQAQLAMHRQDQAALQAHGQRFLSLLSVLPPQGWSARMADGIDFKPEVVQALQQAVHWQQPLPAASTYAPLLKDLASPWLCLLLAAVFLVLWLIWRSMHTRYQRIDQQLQDAVRRTTDGGL